MALDTNFNVNPYYDDFDEDKKFLRLLFKPGFAVQARELTQVQTLLQKQVERFGRHVFENGSLVEGGQTFLQNATFLKLENDYSGVDIDVENFVGQTILSADESKRAEVIRVYPVNSGVTPNEPITLMVKQIYGDAFVSSETIKTNEVSPYFANTQINGVGTGQIFSVSEGVYFYEGFFVKTTPQTVAVSKYSTTGNAKIGFEVTESIVKPTDDTSLLDPALDASNYQAPGADRYKIDLVLSTRDLNSSDTEQFIEIARVENGRITSNFIYPIYSVLEDELARRTYDESGNYTVRPFLITLKTNSSNTAQTDIILSPGKAYVFGYEYESNSPTTITIDKPREKQNVNNKFVSADYGSFVFTQNTYGSLPIDSLTTVDLHCVPVSGINLTSTATISNTKIGTARVKTVEFDSATDTSNSSTYSFKTHLFDIKTISGITGNANTATANTIQIANTVAGELFTTVTDAYAGGKVRIVTGPGSNESPKRISSFNASTQTITVEENFVTTPNSNSIFSIGFEFSEVESFLINTSTTLISSADIDSRSKDFASTYDDTLLSETNLAPLIFDLGEEYVANNISDMVYTYRKLYSTTFGSTDSGALALDSGEALVSSTSNSEKLQNYQIIVRDNKNSAPYANGSIVPPSSITNIDTVLNVISVQNANNMTANIIATITVSSSSQKNKSLITANSNVQTTGGETILSGNVTVFANNTSGQTTIQANTVVKIPGEPQSLYVSDVDELISVYDFNGGAIANTGYTDITSRYTLDNGQRDSFYDHASIRLKPGVLPPNGPLVVRYNYYSSPDAGGYFNVDSYPNYDIIPTYTSPVSGQEFELRDSLDFRPVRKNATAALGTGVEFRVGASVDNPKIVRVGSDIILDYQYYLPRIDKVVLNKNRKFEVVKGVSDKLPKESKDKDNAMTLYVLSNPPYVDNTDDINVGFINNKRYTMRDIGTIEKRVENLEYYTSLSLLENETLTKQDLTILDSTNLSRFKNGIVVDSFIGHAVADVFNDDYKASIDVLQYELRPTFNISPHSLTFDSANSSNFLQSGPFVTANATSVPFVNQPLVSKSVNVNPFNVINFVGKITLNPPSDIWVDTETRPDVLVNIGGDQDAWERLLVDSGASNWQYEWNSWQTRWTGTPTTNISDFWSGRALIRRETVTQQVGQTRTGIANRVVVESITQSIGNRIVDVSVIPFMRSVNVLFVGTDFKSNTTMYPFFDGVPVENNVGNRVNKFYLTTNNIQLKKNLNDPEFVTISDGGSSVGTAIVAHHANNIVYVTNVNPTALFSNANSTFTITGQTTGNVYNVIGYEHNGANANSATTTTITLREDAAGARNIASYNSSPIFIVQGTGVGQQRTITSYNPSTRVATVTPAFDVTPDTTSFYSIGRPKTDESGSIVGIFTIPEGTFRIGEKLFRLVDNITGDLGSSSTNGDATFFAQGLLQQSEEVLISTLAPTIQRQSVNDSRVVTNTLSVSDRVIAVAWSDPLAQTFLVAPNNFENGIFVDKIRLCFKTKDDIVPVTVQIRPTQNGYPSSSIVFPYGTVSLTPDKVKISESPSLDDPTKYTDFEFEAPIYLQPGEYSFVVLANSNKYELFVGEIGKLDIVSNQQISQQPYLGSFFLSQNGSTWSADQSSDIMFRLFRKSFDTSLVTAQFLVNTPSADVPYDLIHPITSEINIANTGIQYNFISEKSTGGLTNEKSVTQLQNYEMNDGDGRRLLNTTTGNTTFVFRATMSTTNSEVSPVLDTTRFGFIAVENIINDLPLLENGFIITDGGSGYTGNVGITISSPTGSGVSANAYAEVSGGNVISVVVDTAGSGYIVSPTITVDAPPVPGGNTTATIIYNGEDKKSGGNSLSRYITRKVTLADGFDSGDLRVYITAYKPSASRILVYYKLLSQSDPGRFEDKEYQLMTEIGNSNFISTNERDFRELTFAPGTSGVPSNSVSYESDGVVYTTFKTFAIKIVMAGTNPTDVPRIRDFRAIALPAG